MEFPERERAQPVFRLRPRDSGTAVRGVLALERRIVVIPAVVNPLAHGSAQNGAAGSKKDGSKQAAQDHVFGTRFHVDLAPISGADADMALSPVELLMTQIRGIVN